MILAMSRNRCIGKAGGLPWHVPEDLKHFRRHTTGHAIIMGRKTHESIGRPLPKRRNIVVTRKPDAHFEGCEVVHDLPSAVALARTEDELPFVIGGATLYLEALPSATVIHLTELDWDVDGDTFFPEIPAGTFEEEERRPGETEGVSFVTLRRTG